MPGLNTTGAPDTRDYILGRGKVYAAELLPSGLPSPAGFRLLGNCPEFTASYEEEVLDHLSSMDCVRSTDKRFVLEQECRLSIQLEELNFQNLAYFFMGETGTYNNPHDVTWATHETAIISASIVQGNWYELRNTTGQRVYNLDAAGCAYSLEEDPAGTPVVLVEGTDYEIDEPMGLVRFLPGSTAAPNGSEIGWAVTAAATTPQDLDEVAGLTRENIEVVILFVQENGGNCGQKREFRYHKVSLTPEGDLAKISEGDLSTITVSGPALKNLAVADTSKVVTVREYDMSA